MSSEKPENEESQINAEDCFKILMATDIHLGYKEKDLIIGKPTDLFNLFGYAWNICLKCFFFASLGFYCYYQNNGLL